MNCWIFLHVLTLPGMIGASDNIDLITFLSLNRYCQQVLNETVRTAKLTPVAARLQEVEGKVDQHVIPKEVSGFLLSVAACLFLCLHRNADNNNHTGDKGLKKNHSFVLRYSHFEMPSVFQIVSDYANKCKNCLFIGFFLVPIRFSSMHLA